ncbi:MAG: hypothetical protein MMC33_005834 [Icmadophila ericetorum]|nr:hypothetical protein [Icmadophila ericetorum]
MLESKANFLTYKLCDLGIAKIWDPFGGQTKKGRGTAAYMPKEVKEQLKPWTIAEDIYSLGATIRDLVKNFEDDNLTALLAQCMDDVPNKRPSSITLLQRAQQELAALECRDMPPFLPDNPAEMDYIHQAIIELLERLFHSFCDIQGDLKTHLTDKLNEFFEDSKLRSPDCWGLVKSATFLLALGRRGAVFEALASGDASWDCTWKTFGLTYEDIAKHDSFLIKLPSIMDRELLEQGRGRSKGVPTPPLCASETWNLTDFAL